MLEQCHQPVVPDCSSIGAPAWWLGYLAQEANSKEVEPVDLGVSPAHVARLIALVADGSLTSAGRYQEHSIAVSPGVFGSNRCVIT